MKTRKGKPKTEAERVRDHKKKLGKNSKPPKVRKGKNRR